MIYNLLADDNELYNAAKSQVSGLYCIKTHEPNDGQRSLPRAMNILSRKENFNLHEVFFTGDNFWLVFNSAQCIIDKM